MNEYDFKKIEEKWSKKWAESDYGKASDNSEKPKHYHLIEFPYPSGAGLHVGHCMGYGASDAYCRMKRMQGFEVMFPIGWDAFGLPTENFAIKNKIKPKDATSQNIANFKKQMNSLALSFDWNREINTTDPKYYRWTQWIFLQFYKHGIVDGKLIEIANDDTTTPRLAYQAEMPVNWCPSCKINLANEEVINGKCERCGVETSKRMQKQWMLRITKYADRLISDLDTVDYEERIKTQQINWIGKSNGSSIRFKLIANSEKLIVMEKDLFIEVFTTRADTLFGATYIVLAPEHPLLANHKLQITNHKEVENYIAEAKKKSDIDRADIDKEKTGVELKGVRAINPINNEEIPIFVADYVLAGYGTGAVMAVPAHDSRDFEFAKKYNLPIQQVIAPNITYHKTPPVDGLEWIERDAVESIIYNPITKKYLCLEWKKQPWTCFVTGGIDTGEDVIKAAKREILEETGFKNVKLIKHLGYTRLRFHAAHKNCNRLGNFQGLLFELENDERIEPSEKEKEIHEVIWLSRDEISADRLICASFDHWTNGVDNKETAFIEYGSLVNSGKFSKLDSKEAMKKITEKLKEAGSGDFAVNYKLRDWIFSRQHYWGEPIPIVYCAECAKTNRQVKSEKLIVKSEGSGTIIDGKEYATVPVPEDQLPVVLPEVENYEPTDTGESPLAKIDSWVNVKCPVCGGDAKRETDTMPNWAGSSWYYLRYCDTKNNKELASIDKLKHWLTPSMDAGGAPRSSKSEGGVDLYNGGMEHTTLHLLYSRFWHKFLFDLKCVPTSEPYQKRIAHGIILGPDGRKMSKSFGNVINPDDMIAEFGADTLRAYIMFIGPYDQESAWNMNGIQGVHRFLKKVWGNFKKVKEGKEDKEDDRLMLELQKTIKGVSEDIERFSMNTYIAKLMEFNNLLVKEKTIPKNIAEKFLILLSPAMPYVAEELWEHIGHKDSIFSSEWPKFDQTIINSDKLEIPIQINGKVRHRVHVLSDISDDELEKMVLSEKIVIDHLACKEPKKVIVVPKKLVSIVV